MSSNRRSWSNQTVVLPSVALPLKFFFAKSYIYIVELLSSLILQEPNVREDIGTKHVVRSVFLYFALGLFGRKSAYSSVQTYCVIFSELVIWPLASQPRTGKWDKYYKYTFAIYRFTDTYEYPPQSLLIFPLPVLLAIFVFRALSVVVTFSLLSLCHSPCVIWNLWGKNNPNRSNIDILSHAAPSTVECYVITWSDVY